MKGRQFDHESGDEDVAVHGDGPPWSTGARRVDTAPDPRQRGLSRFGQNRT